jgi:hypothetical protein
MWSAVLSSPLALALLAALPGHAARILVPAALVAGLCLLGAFLVSGGGQTAEPTALASARAPTATGRAVLDVRRRWQIAFALLAVAAIVVGLGWLASVAVGP